MCIRDRCWADACGRLPNRRPVMANVRYARYPELVFEAPVLTAPPTPGRGAAGARPGVLTRLLTGQPAGITELALTQELTVLSLIHISEPTRLRRISYA